MKEMYKKIIKIIKKYDKIVLARHISPDPDAIASQIALRDSIKLGLFLKKYPDIKINNGMWNEYIISHMEFSQNSVSPL